MVTVNSQHRHLEPSKNTITQRRRRRPPRARKMQEPQDTRTENNEALWREETKQHAQVIIPCLADPIGYTSDKAER